MKEELEKERQRKIDEANREAKGKNKTVANTDGGLGSAPIE